MHSYPHIWIHAIWATKNWQPLTTHTIESLLFNNLHQQFSKMNIKVKEINGSLDHVHVLFKLNPTKSLSEIMKYAKGGSAYFINKEIPIGYFEWQVGYSAFSVSQSKLGKTLKYIQNQKQHHYLKTLKFTEVD